MNEKEILDDMRRLTILTGEISTVHEKSLKNWPYVLFDGLVDMKIEYDLTKDYTKEVGEGFINFFIALEDIEVELFKERCETLSSWVRDMFWKEIKVGVIINNGEEYFNSYKELKANPKNFKEEKHLNEAYKEMKNGPKQN